MMETGTFLREDVQDYIRKYYIPLKFESGVDAEQFLRFGVKATPAYFVLDSKGNEIHGAIGFFNPDDFIRQLEIARANVESRD